MLPPKEHRDTIVMNEWCSLEFCLGTISRAQTHREMSSPFKNAIEMEGKDIIAREANLQLPVLGVWPFDEERRESLVSSNEFQQYIPA